MKKLLLGILTVISIGLMPATAMAQPVRFEPQSTEVNNVGGCSGAAANSTLCTEIKTTENPLFGPSGILTKVGNFFALATGVIAVFMLIISGLRYVNSGGDPAKTASAKNGIIYASIGVAVAAVARVIVYYVLSKL
jgi:hypothetical protein